MNVASTSKLSLDTTEDSTDNTSTTSVEKCQICHLQTKRYTCPACQCKTCSLVCSQTHKFALKCTGKRSKNDFIAMKDYGHLELINDLHYLEEVNRTLGEGAFEIIKGKSTPKYSGVKGKGLEIKQEGRTGSLGKKEIGLKREFALKFGIELNFLPEGMEKRVKNVFKFNSTTKILQMSITFTFRIPFNPSTPLSNYPQFTTQFNDFSHPLQNLLKKPLMDGRGKHLPTHLREILKPLISPKGQKFNLGKDLVFLLPYFSLPSHNFNNPLVTLPVPPTSLNINVPVPTETLPPKLHPSLPTNPTLLSSLPVTNLLPTQPEILNKPLNKKIEPAPRKYYKLNPEKPLIKILKGTKILEWPTIEIWSIEAFERCSREGRIEILSSGDEKSEGRRQREESDEARNVLKSLVGGYGSESDSDSNSNSDEAEL